jgi:hypothetical protein
MGVLWHLEQDENRDEKVDVEMRQCCYQVRDVLCSGGNITQNAALIKRVMELWKEVSAHDRVLNCALHHVCSHGEGVVPDVWNERADTVAKAAADGEVSLVGKFAELAGLHATAKSKKNDKSLALGDGPEIEVSEGEAVLHVDGFADPVSGKDGWFWRMSDGDVELQAGGFTAPLPDELSNLGMARRTVRATLHALVAAFSKIAQQGTKSLIKVMCCRTSLQAEMKIDRLDSLMRANALWELISEAHGLQSNLGAHGCLIQCYKAKKYRVMAHVTEMAKTASVGCSPNVGGVGATDELKLLSVSGVAPVDLSYPVLGPQWPTRGDVCDVCDKVWSRGGPEEVMTHVNAAHKRKKLTGLFKTTDATRMCAAMWCEVPTHGHGEINRAMRAPSIRGFSRRLKWKTEFLWRKLKIG